MSTQKVVVRYADEVVGSYTLYRREVAKRGGILQLAPGQGQDGYGRKITSDIVLRFGGEGRAYRVYATCFSNAASLWIMYQGQKLHLRDHSQSEIQEEE